jgi:hypothetical protein
LAQLRIGLGLGPPSAVGGELVALANVRAQTVNIETLRRVFHSACALPPPSGGARDRLADGGNFQPYRQADQALFEIEAAAELLGERTHQAQTLPGRDRRIEAFGQSYPVVRNFDGQAAVRTFA